MGGVDCMGLMRGFGFRMGYDSLSCAESLPVEVGGKESRGER